MSDGIGSPVNAHLARITELEAEIASLRAENARQAHQITQQSAYVNQLTRELSAAHEEAGRLRARMPRPSGKRYPDRLGRV